MLAFKATSPGPTALWALVTCKVGVGAVYIQVLQGFSELKLQGGSSFIIF